MSWLRYPPPWRWVLLVLDTAILASLGVGTVIAASHIIGMWSLRKEYAIAARSPLLAMLSGIAGIVATDITLVLEISRYGQPDGADLLVVIPAMAVFTFAYIARGCRLVVMFNTRYRRSCWAKIVIKERRTFRLVVGFFLAVQVLAWSLALVLGMGSVAEGLPKTAVLDMLATIVAASVLYSKLRHAQDLLHTSQEILTVGGLSLVGLVLVVGRLAAEEIVPVWFHHFFLCVFFGLRFGVGVYITNIRPVRDVLREKAMGDKDKACKIPLFPFGLWQRGNGKRNGKVAIGMLDRGLSCSSPQSPINSSKSFVGMGRLQPIMESPPLLQAFEDYCLRALCYESVCFLKQAMKFREAVYAGSVDEKELFRQLAHIADKFIKANSTFEINIDSQARTGILVYRDEETFQALDADGKSGILDLAVKETSQVLAENLLEKFYGTQAYTEIQTQLHFMSDTEGKSQKPSTTRQTFVATSDAEDKSQKSSKTRQTFAATSPLQPGQGRRLVTSAVRLPPL